MAQDDYDPVEVGEIAARIVGHPKRVNTFVVQRDTLIPGYRVNVFCVGEFLSRQDRHLPAIRRHQSVIAEGTTWREALERAKAARDAGAKPLAILHDPNEEITR